MSEKIDWDTFHSDNGKLRNLDKVRIAKRYFDNLSLLSSHVIPLFTLLKAVKKSEKDIDIKFAQNTLSPIFGFYLSLEQATEYCVKVYEKAILVKDFELEEHWDRSVAVRILDIMARNYNKPTSDIQFEIIKYVCYNLYTARVDWCKPYME